jgi:8-oxo-dGTP diphosphatase
MSPEKKYCYDYARPALTVDAVIFTFVEQEIKVLMIKRAYEPFKDNWAFPGGFVNEGETAEAALKRELHEETGLRDISLEQFWTASTPGRDPRGWTVSVVFIGFASAKHIKPVAGDDAKEADWHSINNVPVLAFDHNELLKKAFDSIRTRFRLIIIAGILLQSVFTKDEFIQLGSSLGYPEKDVQQRFQRFLRVGLLTELTEKGKYNFDMNRLEQIK